MKYTRCRTTHGPYYLLPQVLHMMMGLERMDRMRMFADELTAVAAPRISRGLPSASRRRVADADDDSASQRSGFSGVSGNRVSGPF